MSTVRSLLPPIVVAALVLFSGCAGHANTEPLVGDPLTGAAGSSDTESDAAVAGTDDGELAGAIRCHTHYRPVVRSAQGELERTVLVPRDDAPGLTSVSERFGNLSMTVSYAGDVPDGAGVLVQVGSDDSHLWTGRYGTPAAGGSSGHGFTGLNYIEHEGSELQVWRVHAE